jgi:hypothetical protein
VTPGQLMAVVEAEKRRRSRLPSVADIEAAAQLAGGSIPEGMDAAELLGLATPTDLQRCVRVKLDTRELGLPEADIARIDRIIDRRMAKLKVTR